MSYTSVKGVTIGRHVEEIEKLRNSHGSAPVVWNEMCIKYLGAEEFGYHEKIDDLWPKYKDKNIPLHQRAVLMMTFDMVIIKKEHYQRAADDIKLFLDDFPWKKDRVNHWPRIKEIFESCEYLNIGFQMTSCGDELFQGDYNEDTEEYEISDWSVYWSLYNELDEVEKVKS